MTTHARKRRFILATNVCNEKYEKSKVTLIIIKYLSMSSMRPYFSAFTKHRIQSLLQHSIVWYVAFATQILYSILYLYYKYLFIDILGSGVENQLTWWAISGTPPRQEAKRAEHLMKRKARL